jgi:hypothetical protein
MVLPVPEFDLSDVVCDDTLDEILNVAAEVIDENAMDSGHTRIERLAQWVAKNVGGEPDATPSSTRRSVDVSGSFLQGIVIWRGTMSHFSMTPAEAREFAVALLRAAEAAEQ